MAALPDPLPVQPIRWQGDLLVLLDQTRLPEEQVYVDCRDVETAAEAIEELRVRGAPAIGVAAAYAVVLAAQEAARRPAAEGRAALELGIARLARTRPTAVNLFWALDRMRRVIAGHPAAGPADLRDLLLTEADRLFAADQEVCRRLGRHGAALLADGSRVLTHCNAGGLATTGYGTALAAIYAAREQGKRVSVFADETRPLLQGSRLTAWELMQNGVDVTVICDNMAATLMRQGRIDCAIVGADRIAANGDVANKIGTYGVAVLAQAHGLPFYVAAPVSTLDLSVPTGAQIPIEERRASEITHGFGRATAPAGVAVHNPAFDVTPQALVSAIVSERGVARPPYASILRCWVEDERA